MEEEASQLIRAIRGTRSQVQLARRLGYKGNPVADWESGRRFPTISRVLQACEAVGIDVQAAFARFHPETAALLGGADDDGIARWMRQHQGGASYVELAERTGRSRFAVARWLTGESRPRLPDFLRLVDALTGRVIALVAELVPIGTVPLMAERQRAEQAAWRLAFDEPWTAAVLRVLETADYRSLSAHRPGFIADVLEIPQSLERRCLEQLERLGVIHHREGRYVPGSPLSIATRAEPAELRALGAFWTEVSLARQRAPRRQGDLFSYNLFSVSKSDLDRIRRLHLDYFREVRSIVAASEPCEAVAMIQVHLMEWPPGPPR
ncbi:MAG: helix-turn-helix domain-containing protein [Myxococcota bacterium]